MQRERVRADGQRLLHAKRRVPIGDLQRRRRRVRMRSPRIDVRRVQSTLRRVHLQAGRRRAHVYSLQSRLLRFSQLSSVRVHQRQRLQRSHRRVCLSAERTRSRLRSMRDEFLAFRCDARLRRLRLRRRRIERRRLQRDDGPVRVSASLRGAQVQRVRRGTIRSADVSKVRLRFDGQRRNRMQSGDGRVSMQDERTRRQVHGMRVGHV